MEHKFVELVRSRMKAAASKPSMHLQVHDKDASSRSGMICSGEQTLYIRELFFDDLTLLQQVAESADKNRGEMLQISDSDIQLLAGEVHNETLFQRCGEDSFIYREKIGRKNILHIVGGGHCALALSQLLFTMDFVVNIYDDRPGLNTMERNNWMHNKAVLSAYTELPTHIGGGENVYIVIMTFGYRTDDLALRSVMNIPVKYLGMIGSKKKISQMFETYRNENFPEDVLQKIHAPAGINIKSETPEEIAVSIAAEIIRIKNTGQ